MGHELRETITISGHSWGQYNGVYHRAEDWQGYPHFANENGNAHLYYRSECYWQLDDRVQDGSRDFYNGGYVEWCKEDWTDGLVRQGLSWSNWDYLTFEKGYDSGEIEYLSAVTLNEAKPDSSFSSTISISLIAIAILAGIR